jgi:trk system potassium uptake protein TrkH
MIPGMTVEGGIRFIDALFTATSAVCVTGLVVVNTATYYTLGGQWVILLLIQIGALGIFTFSTFFVLLLRGDMSLRGRMLIQEIMTHFPYRNLFLLLRNIILFTFVAEFAGAVLLWMVFRIRYPGMYSTYLAIFHSISAFCNAGFSALPNGLEGYPGNPALNFTIMALIIAGGLGFTVVVDIGAKLFRRKPEYQRLSLHSRLVLVTTAILIVGGALFFWLFELNNPSFRIRPFFEQVLIAFFQSVTARTAGFNTVRIGDVTNAGLFLLIFLMFIGASPGSVGGGVKTTTFAIYVVLVISYLRGKQQVEIFGRSIPARITSKAVATIAMAFTLVIVSTILLEVFERSAIGGVAHWYFVDWLFEVVSAFGTVGLSTGVSSSLTTGGKIVIIATMFIGRLGPLGLALSLLGREAEQRYKYPEENVMIG